MYKYIYIYTHKKCNYSPSTDQDPVNNTIFWQCKVSPSTNHYQRTPPHIYSLLHAVIWYQVIPLLIQASCLGSALTPALYRKGSSSPTTRSLAWSQVLSHLLAITKTSLCYQQSQLKPKHRTNSIHLKSKITIQN